MNTKLTLTAITLFAVIMGLSIFSPAMADKLGKSDVCHFEEAYTIDNGDGTTTDVPAEWKVININDNALSAHLGIHGVGGVFDQLIDATLTETDCLARATA